MKYLIVGLGNIGPEYELTRHNIGFLILDKLADDSEVQFTSSRYANYTEVKYKGRSLHLIKPTTFMNLSGKAVNYWMKELKIPKENILVLVDDIALPFGNIRLRPKGSSAGHNGLKNIEELTGGQDYARLKFGIGDNYGKGQQVDYVLSNFDKNEFAELPIKIDKAIDMIKSFVTAGAVRTMNQYND